MDIWKGLFVVLLLGLQKDILAEVTEEGGNNKIFYSTINLWGKSIG